jgi:hypothetical protein
VGGGRRTVDPVMALTRSFHPMSMLTTQLLQG